MSEPICPQCGSGMPCCVDIKPDGTRYSHNETCATYDYAPAICSDCRRSSS